MDPAEVMRQFLQNPDAVRQMYEQTQQAVEYAAPTIPVPQVEVPADVVLHGRLDFIATFPWSSIANLSDTEIKERVMQVFYGESGAWLPRIEPGPMKLWMEKKTDERREPEPRASNLVRGSHPDQFSGGIPGLRDRDDESSPGTAEGGETGIPINWDVESDPGGSV